MEEDREVLEEGGTPPQGEEGPGYVCPYCGARFEKQSSYAAHVRWCRRRAQGGGGGEGGEAPAQQLIVDDRASRLERILRDILPRSREKTIEYILDMFRSNEFYQTPTGLYHLLTLFKLDPGHIRLVID